MRTLAAPSTVLGGRYVVRQCLGEGGWGAVYEGTQTNLGRTVAIKVLHPDIAVAPDRLARFAFEARAAAALGHPNIVQVTDFQSKEGEPAFLVMEMLRGATLAKLLEGNAKLAPARVVWIAHQVLSALDAAHGAGLIHRDVKPENIFLVSATGVDDFVKLLDFGIAKLVEPGEAQVTTTGALLGSPAYMAPEQVTGADLDTRVDIYALGATMYRALTGRLPFDSPNVHSLLFSIAQNPFRPMLELDPALDPALVAVVERALAKDPGQRFESAAAMRTALEPWSASSRRSLTGTVEAPATSRAAPATEPAPSAIASTLVMAPPVPSRATNDATGKRSRAPLIGGAIVLAVAVPAAIFAVTQQRDPPRAEASAVSAATTLTVPSVLDASTTAATSSSARPSNGLSRPKASVAPSGAPSVAPSGAPSGAKPVPVPTNLVRFGGRTARLAGGSFGPFSDEQVRAGLSGASGAINACYADTELEAPEHQRMSWTLAFDTDGNVKAVHPSTAFARHTKLDACMVSALRATKLGPSAKSGELRADFASPTPP